jgi:hypothetical protein
MPHLESERALEIKSIWRNSVLDVLTATDQAELTLGDRQAIVGRGPFKRHFGCDLPAPRWQLPTAAFPIARSLGSTGVCYEIGLHRSFVGVVERSDGTVIRIEDLTPAGHRMSSRGMAQTVYYELDSEESVYLIHGDLTLQIRYVPRAEFRSPPLRERANFTWLNILILAVFLHTLAVALLVAAPQASAGRLDDIARNLPDYRSAVLTPAPAGRASSDIMVDLEASPARAAATERAGTAGSRTAAPDRKMRLAVRGERDKAELAKSALRQLFGAGGDRRNSVLFGSGGIGGELSSALGNITGPEVGDAGGLGGLATRGDGPGGGGLSMRSVGLGGLDTAGRGGRRGRSDYGEKVGRLVKTPEVEWKISSDGVTVIKALDRELIRRVIDAHRAQVRYCYERALVREPGLFGKVSLVWTIGSGGRVRGARVTQSTLSSAEVGRCVASKIRGWRFPKPRGGGVVIVHYPFVFKT